MKKGIIKRAKQIMGRMTYSMIILQLIIACRNDIIVHDTSSPDNGKETELTLTLNIPGMRIPQSRGDNEDYTDPPISFLGFRVEGGIEKIVFIKKYDGTAWDPHPDTGISEGKLQIKLGGVATGGYNRFAVLVSTDATTMLTENISTYEDVKRLEIGYSYYNTFRDHAVGDFKRNGMKMYGELKADTENGFILEAGVPKTFSQEMPLLRMFAGIYITNEAKPDFKMYDIYTCRTAKKGRLYGDVATYTSQLHLPTSDECLTPPDYGHYNGSPHGIELDFMRFHLAEQPNPPIGGGWKVPRLVIGGKYKGTECFYPIDFTYDGHIAGGTKGKPMPIRRNHKYIFTIKEVKGIGYPSIEKALESPENFTNQNIVVVPVVIDEAFTDITFSESGYFLAVDRTALTLQGKHDATSTQNKISVRTNFPGGWRASAHNADGTSVSGSNPWLKPGRGSGATNATITHPVTEELRVITSGKGFKDGYLEVRAGRLSTKVNVEQVTTPLDYVAEYNLAGGSEYGYSFNYSYPSGATLTPAQTDVNFRWATSHANDQSGYYNWYVCTGDDDSSLNPGSKNLFHSSDFFKPGHPGHGYHLPSQWEMAGILGYYGAAHFRHTYNDPNINEACEVGGIKKTFANDYHSPGNNVCYALRFKQGTGTSVDNSSLSDFPLAADNSMLCAFRYTRVGSFASDNNLNSCLKVDCIYLGSGFTGTIDDISSESWWTARASETTTRIFPAAGHIYNDGSGSTNLEKRGSDGSYWVSTAFHSYYACYAYFKEDELGQTGSFGKPYGCSIRLFANK